jgi:hypothetical protein
VFIARNVTVSDGTRSVQTGNSSLLCEDDGADPRTGTRASKAHASFPQSPRQITNRPFRPFPLLPASQTQSLFYMMFLCIHWGGCMTLPLTRQDSKSHMNASLTSSYQIFVQGQHTQAATAFNIFHSGNVRGASRRWSVCTDAVHPPNNGRQLFGPSDT